MSKIVVELFGEPKVTLNKTKIDLGSNDLSLLMVLALSHGRSSLSVEELVTLLHRDGGNAMGMGNVKSCRGKKAEPPGPSAIRKRKLSLFQKLGLELPKDSRPSAAAQAITTQAWVDVVHFDKAIESRDLEKLREAVQLRGRGPLGEPSEPTVELYNFLDEERQKREEQFISVLRDRLIPEDRWNRPEQALDHVSLLLDIPELSPNQVNAFQRLRQELQATPPPPQSLPLMRSLPEMIGRRAEVEAVQRQLQTPGLVTLIGTGGIGKTRLALAVAGQPGEEVPQGVRFIDLAAVTGALLPQAVGQGLGLREEKGYAWDKMVLAHLQDKAMLLVWDNCEQLAGDCANLAREIIAHCPAVRLLATSREPLGTSGEREYQVPVLPLPAPDDPQTPEVVLGRDATHLFAARAQAVRSDFRVTKENSPAIFRICQGLDGLPLAIELAAALAEEYEPAWIADRLDQCFGLLVDGPRATSLRHTSLRAAFDLSYGLLNRAEQKLFRHLGEFPGSFGMEAVEVVSTTETAPAPDVARLLPQLVRKSLLIAEEHGDETRYRLLVTVRQYAQDRLRERGEWEETRRRHREFYLRLAEETHPLLKGPEQNRWLDRLETEHDNLRAALSSYWESREQGEQWIRMVGYLWWFWWVRGYLNEGRLHLAEALSRAKDVSPKAQARALEGLANLVQHQGDFEEARAALEESLELLRGLHDERHTASVLGSLGNLAYNVGDYGQAQGRHEEALKIFRCLEDELGIVISLINLGNLAYAKRDFGLARQIFLECLTLSRRRKDERHVAQTLFSLASVARETGDFIEAARLSGESLILYRNGKDQFSIAHLLEEVAALETAQGQTARAARLWGASEALRERLHIPITPSAQTDYDKQVQQAQSGRSGEEFATAWAEGRAMSWEQAVAFALGEDAS